MRDVAIRQVAVDDEAGLQVVPADCDLRWIYRSGRNVHWDVARRSVRCPGYVDPTDLSGVRRFVQIIAAAAEEYGVKLRLTPETSWQNVSAELRSEIEGSADLDPGPAGSGFSSYVPKTSIEGE